MGGNSILIVDDEPDIRQLLRIFFERQGFKVALANDGQAALDTARQIIPNIIVMDIQMPRKTGIDAVRELRADPRFATTPIIALTAFARVNVTADLIRVGFDQVLFKPIDFASLQNIIATARRNIATSG